MKQNFPLYETLMDIIRGRRSVRKYKREEVSEELLQKVLEASRLAPSWANTQCWRFIVVKDQKMKEEIAEASGYKNPAYNAIKEAPLLIVVVAKKGVSGYYKGQPVTTKGEWWYMFDVALAVDHLTLAAHALGLGTVHVGLLDHERVEKLLNVKEDYTVVEVLPLGYPLEIPKAPPRKSLEEIVYYEKMG